MQNQAPNFASFPNPPIHAKPEADALPSDLRNSFNKHLTPMLAGRLYKDH